MLRDRAIFIKAMASLDTSVEDLQTVIKDKMNWSDKDHRQEQNQTLLLEMHDGARTEQGDYIIDHLEGLITLNIFFSSSQKDGYSSSKLKATIYSALNKRSLMLWSACLLHPQHLARLQALWLNRPGNTFILRPLGYTCPLRALYSHYWFTICGLKSSFWLA